MRASQALRVGTDGLDSIPCSRTPAGGSSISRIERKVRRQLAKGVGILKVAKSLGIGTGTVQRIANELR